jgi:transposase
MNELDPLTAPAAPTASVGNQPVPLRRGCRRRLRAALRTYVAAYHHAILVREWLGQPGRRIRLHFIPSYCPHLDPIERCWGVMHEHVTNNRSYETFAQFRSAILRFLRRTVPKKWDRFRD